MTMPCDPASADDRRYPDRPYVGVGAVVWRGNRVLLVKRGRAPRKGQWSIPGGIQHLGETVTDAARREVREETGLAIEVIDIITVVDWVDRDDDNGVRYHFTLIDVLAEWRDGEARAQDDAADVAWAGLDELHDYGLWSETERVIRLAATRRGRP